MNLRAHPERIFLLKYLFIGLICCGFAVYAAYDGFLAYPAERPRAEAWENLQTEFKAEERTKLVAKWKTMAKENGWSAKQIRKDDNVAAIQNKIYWQYAFIVIGLGSFFHFLLGSIFFLLFIFTHILYKFNLRKVEKIRLPENGDKPEVSDFE